MIVQDFEATGNVIEGNIIGPGSERCSPAAKLSEWRGGCECHSTTIGGVEPAPATSFRKPALWNHSDRKHDVVQGILSGPIWQEVIPTEWLDPLSGAAF